MSTESNKDEPVKLTNEELYGLLHSDNFETRAGLYEAYAQMDAEIDKVPDIGCQIHLRMCLQVINNTIANLLILTVRTDGDTDADSQTQVSNTQG